MIITISNGVSFTPTTVNIHNDSHLSVTLDCNALTIHRLFAGFCVRVDSNGKESMVVFDSSVVSNIVYNDEVSNPF